MTLSFEPTAPVFRFLLVITRYKSIVFYILRDCCHVCKTWLRFNGITRKTQTIMCDFQEIKYLNMLKSFMQKLLSLSDNEYHRPLLAW